LQRRLEKDIKAKTLMIFYLPKYAHRDGPEQVRARLDETIKMLLKVGVIEFNNQ
jgi:hypothetical protein